MSKNSEGETTDITKSKKNTRDSAYGQDSLRFSYEFDRLSTVSSADDKEIDFEFEDYAEFELKPNNQLNENSSNDSFSIGNPTRKIGIFNKYRQNEESPQEKEETDIVHSFDKIFNSNDKEANTKKFLKKKQTDENDFPNNSYKNLGNETEMGQGLFSNASSHSDKKEEDTKDDIFDKIVGKHNEQSQKQVTPNREGGESLSSNHTSFDPFRQSYLGENIEINELEKESTKKEDNVSPLRKKPTIPSEVISPAAQVKMPKVNIKWTYGGNSNTVQEINSDRSIPLGNVNEIRSAKFLLDENKSSDAFDAIPVTNDWNNQNLQLHSNSSFHSIESNESSESKKSDVSLDRSFENLALKDPQGKKSSFNMTLGSETLIRNEEGIKKLSMPIFDEEQQRVAPFLRKIRRMNSIYPNFNHPNINLEMESRFCNSLAGLFEDALKVLEEVVFKVLHKARQANFFPIEFASIEFFTKSQWDCEKQKEWGQINSTIKPKLNFVRSQIDEAKIMKALSNYREVIGYYKQKKVDLTTEEGIKAYFKVREKFWNLEKNMRSISEDVYQLFPTTDYPQFYYDYLNVLKSPIPSKNDTATIKYHKQILDVLISNQQRSEQLSVSAVGQAVRVKIERELKFLFPF